jgi:alpha-tubulin suppressor-like RCC1 family protein
VEAGRLHSLGVRANGSLWAWGFNYHGQLGLAVGDTTNRQVPTQVGAASNWVAVEAGRLHSLGVRANGSLWAWGFNYHGQLGLAVGDTTDRQVPTQVGAPSNWVVVAAGDFHSLGICADGALWAWGYNYYGQLGLAMGDTTNRQVPIQVGNRYDWVMAEGGAKHSLGLRADGSLWAWGYNFSGQLGLAVGDTIDRQVPTEVGDHYDWVIVAAKADHSLGLRAGGSLWAWGWNGSGQLGMGDTVNRTTPTRVPFPNALPGIYMLLQGN